MAPVLDVLVTTLYVKIDMSNSPTDRSRSVEASFHFSLDASWTRNSPITGIEAISSVTSSCLKG